ncbi:hypothetical protein AXA44_22115 [Rhodococcus sp. SC4]|nr:hypothetical protein AXA44_22115 [Rhodococcus sp. SC4]
MGGRITDRPHHKRRGDDDQTHRIQNSSSIFGESWTADQGRCRAVRIGADAERAAKTVLAQNMIERTLDEEMPFS